MGPRLREAARRFADAPEGVAETIRLAVQTGLAGCSVEDRSHERVYERALAAERVAAAVQAAGDLVITARTDGPIRSPDELAGAIARLQAFQEAGAHVLFAPGLTQLDDIRTVATEVDRPLNVLVRPGMAPVDQLAQAGVARTRRRARAGGARRARARTRPLGARGRAR